MTEEKQNKKGLPKVAWIAIGLFVFIIIIASFNGNNTNENSQKTPISFESISRPSAIDNSSSHNPNYINVRYRDGLVDINHSRWEYQDTLKSSWIRGGWYDSENQYMIINLQGVNYHYCGMPESVWASFKVASSFGSYYNNYIKGRYDCRLNPVPRYEDNTGTKTQNIYSYNDTPTYRSSTKEAYLYDPLWCEAGDYCYAEDEFGNEIEVYVYEIHDGYGYGEDESGNEVELYYDH